MLWGNPDVDYRKRRRFRLVSGLARMVIKRQIKLFVDSMAVVSQYRDRGVEWKLSRKRSEARLIRFDGMMLKAHHVFHASNLISRLVSNNGTSFKT